MTEEPPATESTATASDDGAPITCVVAKWYYKRMGLMFLMLFAMGCWFLYDAAVGYPRKKDIWDAYTSMTGYSLQLFPDLAGTDGLPDSGLHLAAVGQNEQGYHFRVFDGEGKRSVDELLPAEAMKKQARQGLEDALEGRWDVASLPADAVQEILGAVSRVVNVNLKGAQKNSAGGDEWRELAKDSGWELEPEEYTFSKIETQWHFTWGMFAAAALVVVVFLLNKGKVLKADGEALYTPAGQRVAFADVFRIDRRKWDHKGLAYAFHREDGKGRSRKATIDDLKFQGADRILKRLLSHFEGELIDRIPDEDDDRREEDGDAAGNPSQDSQGETVAIDPDGAADAGATEAKS